MSAAVEKAMPTMERSEIMFMKFFFLLEKKYRLAMKSERFKRLDDES